MENTAKTTAYPDPEYDGKDIKKYLREGLGLSPKEIVALFGHRTLGFYLNKKTDENESRWSMNPFIFDNNYFVEILDKHSDYLKTPSDLVLLENPEYREFVELFAKDQDAFFEEFSNVYLKVSNFGQENLIQERLQETTNI